MTAKLARSNSKRKRSGQHHLAANGHPIIGYKGFFSHVSRKSDKTSQTARDAERDRYPPPVLLGLRGRSTGTIPCFRRNSQSQFHRFYQCSAQDGVIKPLEPSISAVLGGHCTPKTGAYPPSRCLPPPSGPRRLRLGEFQKNRPGGENPQGGSIITCSPRRLHGRRAAKSSPPDKSQFAPAT